MRRLELLATVAFAVSTGAGQAIAAPDDLCVELRNFETAPLEMGADNKPLRRSVTYYWIGPWLGEKMEWRCERKSSAAAAVKLCGYLIHNVSNEFRARLPIRILECYGYKFAEYAHYDWSNWTATINLRGRTDDRYLLLEIDLGTNETSNGAVRISVIPDEPSKEDTDPPAVDVRHPEQFAD